MLHGFPMTIAKWAEESGLAIGTINDGIRSGNLACVPGVSPRMITPESFTAWIINGKRTTRERNRRTDEAKEPYPTRETCRKWHEMGQPDATITPPWLWAGGMGKDRQCAVDGFHDEALAGDDGERICAG